MMSSAPLDPAAHDLLVSARRQAAVLGAFHPQELLDAVRSESATAGLEHSGLLEVLGLLSQDCEEIDEGEQRLWRMRPEPRRLLLNELSSGGGAELAPLAAAAAKLMTDRFGEVLAATVVGDFTTARQRAAADVEGLTALDSALGFFAGDRGSDGVQAQYQRHDVQAQIQRAEVDQAFRFILPGELIGRDSELEDLRRFVSADVAPPAMGSLFLLRGNGGAGKSALLAEFARREMAKGAAGMPVVWLDFDRPMLASTDPVLLMLELARQLALFWPDKRAALQDFRKQAEALGARATSDGLPGEAELSRAFSEWQAVLQPENVVSRPVVLILDTFEEAISFGEWNADRVMRWIDGLTTEGGLPNLRTIVSGREFAEQWRKDVATRVVGDIVLEGLEPLAARQLLGVFIEMGGAAPGSFDLAPLVERFGGHPLLLKILAKFLVEEGPEAQADLLAGEAPGLRAELAQQLLYTRILSRIRAQDEDMVKLAFPGLALRRVTADLVIEALAEPCALGAIDRTRAEQLVELLRAQVWLVEPSDAGPVVRHRRDLRRLMLEAIPADKVEVLRQIHALAADYYGQGRDPQMSVIDQAVEAQYHRLMAGEALRDLADPTAARIFLDAIGEDLVTLPPRVQAELKFAVGRNLAEREVAELGEADRRVIEDERAFAASEAGYQPPEAPIPPPAADRFIDVRVSEAFARGELEGLCELAEEALDRDFLAAEPMTRREQTDLTGSSSWRVAIAMLARGRRDEFGSLLSQVVDQVIRSERLYHPLRRTRGDAVALGEALAMLAVLVGERNVASHLEQVVRKRSRGTVGSFEALRAVSMLPPESHEKPYRLHLELIRFLAPATVKWLRREFASRQQVPRQLDDWFRKVQGPVKQPLGRLLAISSLTVAPDLKQPAVELGNHGRVAEIYAPIVHLAEIAPIGTLIDVTRDAASTAFAWPSELDQENLPRNLSRERKRWSSTLIEVADRAGALGPLVERLAAENPRGADILALLRAYQDRLTEIDAKPFRLSKR